MPNPLHWPPDPEIDPPEDYDPLGWWTISGTNLIVLLRRAHMGESPDLLYAEAYANSEVHANDCECDFCLEWVDDDGDDDD